VDNYSGSVADRTGVSEVRIEVGTKGNDGHFAYTPAALLITTGTTVIWEWTGSGGAHNVVGVDDQFYSGEPKTNGQFVKEFTSPGVVRYFCGPHRELGMKGALVVRE
jgi:halocyanin-like protein